MKAPIKKIVKDHMGIEDIRGLIKEFFQTLAELVPAEERRCLLLQVFLYFR